jgi:RecB family endonuclease NucS
MAMTSLLRSLFKPTHDQMVGVIADALLEERWDVQREPIVGTVRPDIVAHGPEGATYVIEVKQGNAGANLGAVAQVEAYRNALAREVGGEVKGVLVVAGDAPERLGAAAKGAGVELVRTESVDVGSVRDLLARSGILGEPLANGSISAA